MDTAKSPRAQRAPPDGGDPRGPAPRKPAPSDGRRAG